MTWDQFMAVLPAGLTVLITGLLYGYQLLLAHLPEARRTRLQALAYSVVRSVEQTGQGQPNGVKKAAALQLLTQLAKDFHLPLTPALLEVLIEAAVLGLPKTSAPAPIPPTDAPAVPAT